MDKCRRSYIHKNSFNDAINAKIQLQTDRVVLKGVHSYGIYQQLDEQ